MRLARAFLINPLQLCRRNRTNIGVRSQLPCDGFNVNNNTYGSVHVCCRLEISKGAVSYRVRHNKIVPNTKSKAEYDVNGRPTGQGTLAALAKYLQRRQPGFKDPLTAGILGFAMVTDVMLESRLEAEAVTQQAKVDDEASAKAADIAAHREKTKEASARYKAGASTDQEESEQRLAEVGTASLQDAREIAAVEVSRIRQKQLLEKKRNELIAQKSAEFAEDVQTLNKALEHADLLKRSGSPEEPDSDSDEEAPDDAATDVWKPMKRRGSFNGTGGTPPAIMHPVMDELEAYGKRVTVICPCTDLFGSLWVFPPPFRFETLNRSLLILFTARYQDGCTTVVLRRASTCFVRSRNPRTTTSSMLSSRASQSPFPWHKTKLAASSRSSGSTDR